MRLNMVTGVSPAPARSRNGLPRPRVQVQSDTAKQPRNRLFPQSPPASYWEREGRGRGVCWNWGEGSRVRDVLTIVSFDSPVRFKLGYCGLGTLHRTLFYIPRSQMRYTLPAMEGSGMTGLFLVSRFLRLAQFQSALAQFVCSSVGVLHEVLK